MSGHDIRLGGEFTILEDEERLISYHKPFYRLTLVLLAVSDPAGAGDLPGSGPAVNFENGGYHPRDDTVQAIKHLKAGDPVRMCLVSIQRHCPKGDDRGRVYRIINPRTHQSWKPPDSAHTRKGA
jgi:hypothetical protein